MQGAYWISGNGNNSFAYSSSEPYGLVTAGGYTEGCAARVLNAANTVLDGEGIQTRNYGFLHLNDTSSSPYVRIIVDGLTVQNGKDTIQGDFTPIHIMAVYSWPTIFSRGIPAVIMEETMSAAIPALSAFPITSLRAILLQTAMAAVFGYTTTKEMWLSSIIR